MIVNVDAKSLEVVCAAFLSQDPLLIEELTSGADIHGLNQTAFNLPEGKEGRLIAKILVFRILYGGTEYSFAQDPNFEAVSTSVKYWKQVIDKFYNKYKRLAAWHTSIVQEATKNKKLVMPTGREYSFGPLPNGEWPITQIKNFPVQGFGADIMAVIRVAFYKRFVQEKIKGVLVSSVHDSIVCDVEEQEVERVAALYNEVFDKAPQLFEQWFGVPFNLPLRCEVSAGPNMNNLTEIK